MLRHPALIIVLAILFASSVFAQTVETKPKDIENEVANLKAENATVREQLRKMEEQQKALVEQFERLLRRLDGPTTVVVQPASEIQPADPPTSTTNLPNGPAASDAAPSPAPVQEPDTNLLTAGSVWWEPLGAYSEPGKSRQMYDDYFASKNFEFASEPVSPGPEKIDFQRSTNRVLKTRRFAGGFKWYMLPTERLWLTGALMRVYKAPYSGAFTPYTAGMDGWMPMIQTVLAF